MNGITEILESRVNAGEKMHRRAGVKMHFLSGAYRFGTANGNTFGVAMSEDPPEAIASARCASPGGGSGVRSHSSALLDNGSPIIASKRADRPIFVLNLW